MMYGVQDEQAFCPALPKIFKGARGAGFTNVTVDSDGSRRRIEILYDIDGEINRFIEFDGRQHFSGPEASWKKTRTLEEIQQADEIKNKYCKEHNIVLKRISYFQISKISLDTINSDVFNI